MSDGDGDGRAAVGAGRYFAGGVAEPAAVEVPIATVPPYAPASRGPILVLLQFYWGLVITGAKKLEIRNKSLRHMKRHVGRSGVIWGTVTLGRGRVIESDREWMQLLDLHHWDTPTRPYEQTFALPVEAVEIFTSPIAYQMMPGQIGTARYRPLTEGAADVPRASSDGSRRPRAGEVAPSRARKRPAGSRPATRGSASKRPRWSRDALRA